MSGEAELKIKLSAVDKATAKLNSIGDKLEKIGKPAKEFEKALAKVGEHSGIGRIAESFRGVREQVSSIIAKVAGLGFAGVAAAAGVKHVVDEFDQMGDLAERIGVSVDFLGAMRYAAERSGASIEALDQGLQTFGTNIGAARAGTGKMLKFLNTVSPALAKQLTATKSNEEAFRLLADAMAKLPDADRRLKLAAATMGDPSLAPMLARGAKGIGELEDNFRRLAGPLDAAADGAGKVDDSLRDTQAVTVGLKAALLRGLAPALKVIVDRSNEWLVAHRGDIEVWATKIGKELPDAVAKLAAKVSGAAGAAADLVDKVGGIGNAALIVAGIMTGPLIASILRFGIALLATPIGPFVAAAMGIGAVVAVIIAKWEPIKEFFAKLWDAVIAKFDNFVARIKHPIQAIADLVDAIHPGSEFERAAAAAQRKFMPGLAPGLDANGMPLRPGLAPGLDANGIPLRPGLAPGLDANGMPLGAAAMLRGTMGRVAETRVRVDFANAPRGTRVVEAPGGTAGVDLSVGYQMGSIL